jgi:hypothetical protein
VTALVVGLTVAVGLLGLLVVGLLRAHAEILRALHAMGVELDPSKAAGPADPHPLHIGPTRGRPTPGRPDAGDVIDLSGTTPSGDAVSLAVSGVRHDTLIAFLTSGCATCRAFWDVFRVAPPDVPGGARLVAVTRGSDGESPGVIAGLAGATPVVMSTELWEHYDVPYAPYFVYVSGPAGRVMGEGVAAGWEEVKALVANAVADGTTDPFPRPRGWHARSAADQQRDQDVDRHLAAAGILPGDPRLYPTSISDGGDQG